MSAAVTATTRRRALGLAAAGFAVVTHAHPASAQLDRFLKGLTGGGLSDAKIGSGLKVFSK